MDDMKKVLMTQNDGNLIIDLLSRSEKSLSNRIDGVCDRMLRSEASLTARIDTLCDRVDNINEALTAKIDTLNASLASQMGTLEKSLCTQMKYLPLKCVLYNVGAFASIFALIRYAHIF